MNDIREKKQEASMPVQSRIDVRVLAELALYWEDEVGSNMRSLSQLVSWSLDGLRHILASNDMMKVEVESLEEAFEILDGRRLTQASLMKKSRKKMLMSRGFENMRREGGDPKTDAGYNYKIMHNSHSVETSPERVRVVNYNKDDPEADARAQEMVKKYVKLKEKEEGESSVDVQDLLTDKGKREWKGDEKKEGSDRPRPLTEDEMRDKEIEIEERDREIALDPMEAPEGEVVELDN